MARQLHLTSGSITPQLIRLCIPLLCANVLQQLYNIINSLVVTWYIGDNAFAALGVAERFRRMEGGLTEALSALRGGEYARAERVLEDLLRLDQEEENGL